MVLQDEEFGFYSKAVMSSTIINYSYSVRMRENTDKKKLYLDTFQVVLAQINNL